MVSESVIGTIVQTVAGLLEPWEWEATLRLLLCVVIGGALGLEREYHGRAAGFRTHILVCLGCCIIILASTHFVRLYEHMDAQGVVRLDPARLAYGVVAGIGFLGAGVIMKAGGNVHGLTTAASLWSVAALGLSMGLGMYYVATFGTILALLTLVAMRQVGSWVQGHHYRVVRVSMDQDADRAALKNVLTKNGAKVLRDSIDHRCAEGQIIMKFELRFGYDCEANELYEFVRQAGTFDRIEIE